MNEIAFSGLILNPDLQAVIIRFNSTMGGAWWMYYLIEQNFSRKFIHFRSENKN